MNFPARAKTLTHRRKLRQFLMFKAGGPSRATRRLFLASTRSKDECRSGAFSLRAAQRDKPAPEKASCFVRFRSTQTT